jgi:glyoxylase-like metal-dependent hydrolase (beta-lactamase superfamily II)
MSGAWSAKTASRTFRTLKFISPRPTSIIGRTKESFRNPALGPAIGPIRDALLPLRDRMIFLKDGQDVVPGVQALLTPGHTVGHTSFVISSQGSSIVNIADLAHQPLLQMDNPRAEFARDTDPQQGVTARLRVFDMVASQKIPIIAYHFPWPGVGHVAKRGEGYRYVAADMQTVL